MHVASGNTDPGDWEDYDSHTGGGADGITVTVDTSPGRFTTTPHYLFTLEGDSPPGGMYAAGGVNAVYKPTPTSFQVILRWADTKFGGSPQNTTLFPNPIRAQAAKNLGWHVKWTGIET